jgi:hypothetical protein
MKELRWRRLGAWETGLAGASGGGRNDGAAERRREGVNLDR